MAKRFRFPLGKASERLLLETIEDRLTPSAPAYLELGSLVPVGVTEIVGGERYVIARQDGDAGGGLLAIVAPDSKSWTETPLRGVSGNAVAASIARHGELLAGTGATKLHVGASQGLVWSTADLARPAAVIESGLKSNVAAYGVSDTGKVVGQANGLPFVWTSEEGIGYLPTTAGSGVAAAISANGAIIVGSDFRSGAGPSTPVFWNQNGMHVLATAGGSGGSVADVSPNGYYFAGWTIDSEPGSPTTAVVWDAGRQIHAVPGLDGSTMSGKAWAVSNNGYVVGETAGGEGWIYRVGWQKSRLFNEWLESEFNLALPHASSNVRDVYFDGVDLNFVLSAGDLGYFVTVSPFVQGTDDSVPTHWGTPNDDYIVVDVDAGYDNGGFIVDAGGGNDIVVVLGSAQEQTQIFIDMGYGNDVVIVDAGGPLEIFIDFGPGRDQLLDWSDDNRVQIDIIGGWDDPIGVVLADMIFADAGDSAAVLPDDPINSGDAVVDDVGTLDGSADSSAIQFLPEALPPVAVDGSSTGSGHLRLGVRPVPAVSVLLDDAFEF